jgi:arginine repressor
MLLKDYLKYKKINQAELLKIIYIESGKRVPQSTMSKWILGIRIPRYEDMQLIYRITNKKVDANSFYNIEK